MAALSRSLFKSRKTIFTIQTRGKVYVEKPHTFERRKMLSVIEPIYSPSPYKIQCDYVRRKKPTRREPHVYEILMSRLVIDNFSKSECVAIFHRNKFLDDDEFQVKKKFFKAGMTYARYPTDIVRLALHDTKFRPALELFNSLRYECFVFCERHLVGKLISLNKKMPQLVLIGGIIEDKLMSKREMINYSKMPDTSVLHFQLSKILESHSQTILNNLQQCPKELGRLLANIKISDTK